MYMNRTVSNPVLSSYLDYNAVFSEHNVCLATNMLESWLRAQILSVSAV